MLNDDLANEQIFVNVFSDIAAMIRRIEIRIVRRNAMSIVDWQEYDQWRKRNKY